MLSHSLFCLPFFIFFFLSFFLFFFFFLNTENVNQIHSWSHYCKVLSIQSVIFFSIFFLFVPVWSYSCCLLAQQKFLHTPSWVWCRYAFVCSFFQGRGSRNQGRESLIIMNEALLVELITVCILAKIHSVLYLWVTPKGGRGCLMSPPVWNLRAVIWFHFAISSLVLLPSPVTLSVFFFFCLLVFSSKLFP